MPITSPASGPYPSIEDVFNATRVHLNDTFAGLTNTVGEGRVFIDTWTPSITILNLALQRLQRDLKRYGVTTTREVVFIINGITPLNGPLGLGVPDPSLQVQLSFNGYWDGQILHTNVALPFDLLMPLKIQQRITNSGITFTEIGEARDGLPSMYQSFSLGYWEWRQDSIFFNGSQNTMDIELTYMGGFPRYPTGLPSGSFSSTLIPFLDSLDMLSYLCAYIFSAPRVPKGMADDLESNYELLMLQLANTTVQQLQRVPMARQQFGSDNYGTGGDYFGW